MPNNVDRMIDQLYADREVKWARAATIVQEWLQEASNRLLHGGDEMRIDASKQRIKERGRALDKLNKRLAESPDLHCESLQHIEEALHDLVGVKVLCKSPRDQRAIFQEIVREECLGQLSIVGTPKDYVRDPKQSGYRACHVTVLVPMVNADPVRVEIQIKTRLQDAWGELTHEDLYKPGAPIKSTPFHGGVASAMAELLATVDLLADQLAEDLDSTVQGSMPETVDQNPGPVDFTGVSPTRITVRTTGPRYALAVDDAGRQGLIRAVDVKSLLDTADFIRVDRYINVDDELDATVEETDAGCWYQPVELADRSRP